jgi:hypothetical protein
MITAKREATKLAMDPVLRKCAWHIAHAVNVVMIGKSGEIIPMSPSNLPRLKSMADTIRETIQELVRKRVMRVAKNTVRSSNPWLIIKYPWASCHPN